MYYLYNFTAEPFENKLQTSGHFIHKYSKMYLLKQEHSACNLRISTTHKKFNID